MQVTLIAATEFVQVPKSIKNTRFGKAVRFEDDIDGLHEFAGRACYKSWERPNPATEANEDYLDHIIESEHLSVLEHGQVTFYVEDVSRSLLLELERHGRNSHLSFSVESQRYVNTSRTHKRVVVPPIFRDDERLRSQAVLLQRHYEKSLNQYDQAFLDAREAGYSVKEAREAARSFLPNATPVDFVVTADIRGWREVVAKRDAEGADREIREFAQEIERQLIEWAPSSMQ